MAVASLESVHLKLNRAQDQLEDLTHAVAKFIRDKDTYSLVAQVNNRRRVVLRVAAAKPPPVEWGVRIGECVFNYHSALDHLAFQLAVANAQRAVPKAIAESSAFPIFDNGPKFRAFDKKGKPTRTSGLYKIRGTSPAAQAIIESLQPYHRRTNPRARALWQLQELSRIDKHRLLHVTHSTFAFQPSLFKLSSPHPLTILGHHFWPGVIEPDAVIAEWHIQVPPDTAPDVHVDAEIFADIAFDRPGPSRALRGLPVIYTLFSIAEFIADDVLPPLAAEMGLECRFQAGALLDATKGEFLIPPQ